MSTEDNVNGVEELTIYREYIHHIPTQINVNNPKFKHIDIILCFASETYKNGKGTGHFKPTWNVEYVGIEWVRKLKEDIRNARVIISIGGVGSEFPFNPDNKEAWIANAIESIKNIIQIYDVLRDRNNKNIIDGIDINYDVIETNKEEFSECIGHVIKRLKDDVDLSINVISISPTELVESKYLKLYLEHKRIIDLVDYKFFNQKFKTVTEVVDLYKKLVDDYKPAKVLPGLKPFGDDILRQAIRYLAKHKLIPGIFYWKIASDSTTGPDPFSLEKLLENI